jgi:hypothetical protein
MGIPWPVASVLLKWWLWRRRGSLPRMLSFVAASLNRDQMKTFHLISRRLYQIHHCLPCTYGQSIAPLQDSFWMASRGVFRQCVRVEGRCVDRVYGKRTGEKVARLSLLVRCQRLSFAFPLLRRPFIFEGDYLPLYRSVRKCLSLKKAG